MITPGRQRLDGKSRGPRITEPGASSSSILKQKNGGKVLYMANRQDGSMFLNASMLLSKREPSSLMSVN